MCNWMLDTGYWIKKEAPSSIQYPETSIQYPVSRNQYKEMRTNEYRS